MGKINLKTFSENDFQRKAFFELVANNDEGTYQLTNEDRYIPISDEFISQDDLFISTMDIISSGEHNTLNINGFDVDYKFIHLILDAVLASDTEVNINAVSVNSCSKVVVFDEAALKYTEEDWENLSLACSRILTLSDDEEDNEEEAICNIDNIFSFPISNDYDGSDFDLGLFGTLISNAISAGSVAASSKYVFTQSFYTDGHELTVHLNGENSIIIDDGYREVTIPEEFVDVLSFALTTAKNKRQGK